MQAGFRHVGSREINPTSSNQDYLWPSREFTLRNVQLRRHDRQWDCTVAKLRCQGRSHANSLMYSQRCTYSRAHTRRNQRYARGNWKKNRVRASWLKDSARGSMQGRSLSAGKKKNSVEFVIMQARKTRCTGLFG